MRRTATTLTERYVAGLSFRGSDFIVWDEALPGFGVRVWRGGKSYVVQFKVHGVDRRKTLGACNVISLLDARERARKLKGAVAAGRDPFTEEQRAREAWSLRDAMDYFIGDYAARRRILDKAYRRNSIILADNHVPRTWWSRKLSTFGQDEIAKRHSEMSDTARNANALLQLLSRLFSLGIEKGFCDRNPVKGVKRYEETKRDRYLTDRELSATWKRLETHPNVEAATCAMLILLTGCRPSEAFIAKWKHIDLEASVWHKPAENTKQRKVHKVRLSERAVAILRRIDTAKRSPYIFPSPSDPSKPRASIRGFWDALREDLSLPDMRIYDLRHTFASHLTMLGAGVFEVKEALGHASITTTQRYVHLSDDQHRKVAELMSQKLPVTPMLNGRDLDQVPRQVVRKGKKIIETSFQPVPESLTRLLSTPEE